MAFDAARPRIQLLIPMLRFQTRLIASVLLLTVLPLQAGHTLQFAASPMPRVTRKTTTCDA
jgi:hypothetical protein